MRRLLLSALLISGCSREPTTLAECPDATCLRTIALRTWETDPAGITTQVAALPDPVLQLAVVSALVEAHPGATRDLCRALPKGPARTRCEDLNERPHLLTGPSGQPADPYDAARGAGPASTVLLPTDPSHLLPSPWASVAAISVTCDNALVANACHEKAATEAAVSGDWERAAGICHGVEDGRWREECSFRAAEAALRQKGASIAADAAGMCLDSGTYGPSCLAHLAMIVAEAAPAADDARPDAWAGVEAGLRAAHERLAAVDPGLADRVDDRTWSEATLRAYAAADTVVGNPLRTLPAAAAPHVRAALAWRLWALEGSRVRTIAEWQARLDEALAASSSVEKQPLTHTKRGERVVSLWDVFLPGEERISTVLYLGQARRGLNPDPSLDALVCLIEAAARQPSAPVAPMLKSLGKSATPTGTSLLLEALTHPDAMTRWTAGRLLAATDTRGEHHSALAEHPDALVRAQLTRPRSPH